MHEELKKRITELAARAEERGYYIYTEFLSPSGICAAEELRLPVERFAFGGADFCERKMLRFGSFGYDEPFPLSIIKISPAGEKFFKAMTHRDYLGALMSLGIERDRVGDVFTDGKTAYAVIASSLTEHVVSGLDRVGGNSVRCSVVSEIPLEYAPKAESVRVSVASLRLDALLSRVYGLSRDDGAELIRAGSVFVNGRLCESAGYTPKEGETITVRGYGKLQYCEINGTSSKGRLFVTVKRYK